MPHPDNYDSAYAPDGDYDLTAAQQDALDAVEKSGRAIKAALELLRAAAIEAKDQLRAACDYHGITDDEVDWAFDLVSDLQEIIDSADCMLDSISGRAAKARAERRAALRVAS